MYLPPNVTSSCKMARTKPARIPGCGSGEAVPDLTSLALEHPGLCSSHSRGQGTDAGAPRVRASGKHKRLTHLSVGPAPQGEAGDRNRNSKRERVHMIEGDIWKGVLGGGLSVTLKQSGWLSVCLQS